jgi:hypothetical protein
VDSGCLRIDRAVSRGHWEDPHRWLRCAQRWLNYWQRAIYWYEIPTVGLLILKLSYCSSRKVILPFNDLIIHAQCIRSRYMTRRLYLHLDFSIERRHMDNPQRHSCLPVVRFLILISFVLCIGEDNVRL